MLTLPNQLGTTKNTMMQVPQFLFVSSGTLNFPKFLQILPPLLPKSDLNHHDLTGNRHETCSDHMYKKHDITFAVELNDD